MREIRLEAEPRTSCGSRSARALRRAGYVPAVVYGFGEPALPIQLKTRDVHIMLKGHAEHSLINLVVGGTSQNVVVRDLQWDILRRELLHVDFQHVHLDEEISVDVEVVLDGSPVGVREGGILEFFTRTLHVRALPSNLPEAIHVDVSGLGRGESIHVRDLPPMDGVTVMNDPETVIAAVAAPRVETEPAAEPSVEEPEIVGRRTSEEE